MKARKIKALCLIYREKPQTDNSESRTDVKTEDKPEKKLTEERKAVPALGKIRQCYFVGENQRNKERKKKRDIPLMHLIRI